MKLSRILFSVALASLLSTGGCALDGVSSRSDAIQSCYDTGHGTKCVSTPGSVDTALADVDGDGQVDTFVCGDGVSESDSDADGADSDTSAEEDAAAGEGDEVAITEDGTDDGDDDLDADSESNSESASESDDPCAASDEASDDDSDSDAEGDGDADGVSDANDCDCIAQTDPVVIQ